MKTSNISVIVVLLLLSASFFGCGRKRAPVRQHPEAHAEVHAQHEHSHEVHHGGTLNAIESCEIGHAEVRLHEDTIELWFVGGGADTGRAVTISDPFVTLEVTLPDGRKEILRLETSPLELAGEKVGDCSHFVGKAEWLKGIENFKARGEVDFRGAKRQLIIEYPQGYDPEK